MNKRILTLALAFVLMLSLASCSGEKEFTLSYTSDGSDKMDYIYYTDERVVYVIGGMMMINIEGEAQMLEMALDSGEITIEEIIAASEQAATDGDIDYCAYPDGSRDYYYDGFNIVVMNTHLRNVDVYFVPTGMGYFDVIRK